MTEVLFFGSVAGNSEGDSIFWPTDARQKRVKNMICQIFNTWKKNLFALHHVKIDLIRCFTWRLFSNIRKSFKDTILIILIGIFRYLLRRFFSLLSALRGSCYFIFWAFWGLGCIFGIFGGFSLIRRRGGFHLGRGLIVGMESSLGGITSDWRMGK